MEEVQDRRKRIKYETYNDHLENAKRYNIPRAQLIIADIPVIHVEMNTVKNG